MTLRRVLSLVLCRRSEVKEVCVQSGRYFQMLVSKWLASDPSGELVENAFLRLTREPLPPAILWPRRSPSLRVICVAERGEKLRVGARCGRCY